MKKNDVEKKERRAQAGSLLPHCSRILKNMYESVLVTDLEGKIIEWNPAAEKLYGYSRREMLGQTAEKLNRPGEGKKISREIMAGVKSRGRWRGQIAFVRKDGVEGVVEATVILLEDRKGRPDAIVSFNRDVTELRRASEEIREALERFNAIIENTPMVAVAGFERDGTVRHWNQAAVELYGFSAEEAVGRRIQDLLGEDEETGCQSVISRVWDSGRAAGPMEFLLTDKAGVEKWVYSSFFPIFSKGSVSAVFCMDVDITERKKNEEKLQETTRFLEGLFESIQDGISVLDVDLTIRHVNGVMNRWYRSNTPPGREEMLPSLPQPGDPLRPLPDPALSEDGEDGERSGAGSARFGGGMDRAVRLPAYRSEGLPGHGGGRVRAGYH